MTLHFIPGDACPGGGGEPPVDVENLILCDKDVNGDIVGTALAVYEYDETGVPTGPPTFVVPGTNTPYVVQGTLSPCEQCQPAEPRTFYFTTSNTAPTDFPGRSYSGNLLIAPGRSVTALNIGGTNFPVGINWRILDLDGTDFASALQAAIQQRIPGSTVTVTPPALDVCDPGLRPFAITIDCIDQDKAPTNVDIVRDAGQDLILNPAFLRPDGTPQFNPGQFGYTTRQDNGGQVACTNVAGRGWQTNDPAGTFEQWGAGFLGTTPTPRGTAIQEINSQGENTIWQVITPPVDSNYTLRAFVGGRGVAEQWNIRLSTGDTGATGIGDLVNITQTAPPVGNTANPQPWTRIEQLDIPLLGGVQYTISAKGPSGRGSVGGLFTDLQLFSEEPAAINSLTSDDTCINTRDVTTNTVVCEQWTPQRDGNCEIVAWEKLDTKEIMTHAAFFAQVPAPVGCYIAPEGEDPEVTFGNLIHTYSVCSEGRGFQRTLITDNSGAAISESWTDSNGVAVGAPLNYTIGACPDTSRQITESIVCADGVQAIRRTVFQGGSEVSATYITADGVEVTPTNWAPGPCVTDSVDVELLQLCDDGANLAQFQRRIIFNADGSVQSTTDLTFAGAPYVLVGDAVQCAGSDQDVVTQESTIQRQDLNANGTIAAGTWSVSITGIEGTASVNGVPLLVGETVSIQGFYDEAQKIFFRNPEINYDATGALIRVMIVG